MIDLGVDVSLQEVLIIVSIGFLATALTALFLIATQHIHGKFSMDFPGTVQKSHDIPTPRIGGVAIVIGFGFSLIFMHSEEIKLAIVIGFAGLPALLFGLAEDFTKSISIRARLAATILSGLIFVIFSGYSLGSVEIYGLNILLTYPVFALAFTAFAIGGVANSINLIDGFHGLAAGTSVFSTAAFAIIGWRVGDDTLVLLALTFMGVFLGFLVINFPGGKIFLGDGGAYFSGYLVAVLAVMLPVRNPEISPWVSLLVLGYPVTETVVSILRRFSKDKARLGQPDRGHLHHVVYEMLHKNTWFGLSRNPLTSVIVWILPGFTLILSTVLGFHFWPIIFGFAGLIALYFIGFGLAIRPPTIQAKRQPRNLKTTLQADHD